MASLAPTGSRCQHFGGAGTCWAAAAIRAQLSFKLGADKGKINVHLLCKSLEWFQMFPSSLLPQLSTLQSPVGGFNPSLPQSQAWICPGPCVGRGCQDPQGQRGGFWPCGELPYPYDFCKNHSLCCCEGAVCLISIFNNIKPHPEVQGGICPRSGLAAAAGTVVVQKFWQRLWEPWGVG